MLLLGPGHIFGGFFLDSFDESSRTFQQQNIPSKNKKTRNKNKSKRVQFAKSEEELFAYQIRRFQISSWQEIKDAAFPHFSAFQLGNKYRNCNIKDLNNPISQVKRDIKTGNCFDSFSASENQKFADGLLKYNNDWLRISQNYLPHRGPKVLEIHFNSMAKDIQVFVPSSSTQQKNKQKQKN